jgi:transcriptional regulator with XRE-family HTH domain
VDKVLERLKELKGEESRYAYADTVTNAFLTGQIKALQKARGLTQEELAERVHTQQSGISRWMNSGFSTCKVETLRKFARAYGVRLRISFESFGTLPTDINGFTEERLAPPRFEDDLAFKESTNDSERCSKRSTARVLQWPAAAGFSPPIERAQLAVINAERSVPQDLVAISKFLALPVRSTEQTNVPESFTYGRKTA